MNQKTKTELENFRELARHVLSVPKSKVDKLERKRKKRKSRKNT